MTACDICQYHETYGTLYCPAVIELFHFLMLSINFTAVGQLSQFIIFHQPPPLLMLSKNQKILESLEYSSVVFIFANCQSPH